MLALYANVLRERSEYPDAGDYMRAAFDLSEGRPLHERYIYPPLLAAACELLVPLGRGECARPCGSGTCSRSPPSPGSCR